MTYLILSSRSGADTSRPVDIRNRLAPAHAESWQSGTAEAAQHLRHHLITAWIDEDEAFKTLFDLTVTVAETYLPAVMASEREYPSKKRQLNKLAAFFSYAVATGGDMTPALAESLLDDLSTDGHKLHSAKIDDFEAKLLTLLQLHGPDIPVPALTHLNGW